jgi:N-acetyl-alpha-D-muramate 1-phosphate uridylyltransferase
MKPNNLSTQAVILAGGMATRLGELSKQRPKSMIMFEGEPFLGHQLHYLHNHGVQNVLLCVGHLKEQIIEYFGDGHKYDVEITYSCEDRPLGTAGALKNAEHLISDVFFTIYGDSYLSLDFSNAKDYFLNYEKLALMTVYRNSDRYDLSNTSIENGFVTRYDKKDRRGLSYIDYGANFFRKEVLKLVPPNQFYPLEDLFQQLIPRRELLALEVDQRFYEIGSYHGLDEFAGYISNATKGREK